MRKLTLAFAAVALCARRRREPATAQQNEQFMPALVYRTGAYAPNGIPFADGVADYWSLLNERDGGINGVKITFEECETGYATDNGVECYERLKGKGPTGASLLLPALDRHHLRADREGAGRQDPAADHGLRPRRKPQRRGVRLELHRCSARYWTAADVAIQHIAKELGGFDKLKGKKISLVYHDSPTARSRSRRSRRAPRCNGFTFKAIPVTHPGVEQKSQWLQIRQDRPDYVLLWGWGVMNSTAINEAAAVNYPRDKMIGVWWSGAEPDVIPAGDRRTGYKALMLQHRRRQVRGPCRPREVRHRQGQVGRQARRGRRRCSTTAA